MELWQKVAKNMRVLHRVYSLNLFIYPFTRNKYKLHKTIDIYIFFLLPFSNFWQ